MDLVSSFVMLITSRLAARASVYKYPVVSYLLRNSIAMKVRRLMLSHVGSYKDRDHRHHPLLCVDDYRRHPATRKSFPMVFQPVGDRWL